MQILIEVSIFVMGKILKAWKPAGQPARSAKDKTTLDCRSGLDIWRRILKLIGNMRMTRMSQLLTCKKVVIFRVLYGQSR